MSRSKLSSLLLLVVGLAGCAVSPHVVRVEQPFRGAPVGNVLVVDGRVDRQIVFVRLPDGTQLLEVSPSLAEVLAQFITGSSRVEALLPPGAKLEVRIRSLEMRSRTGPFMPDYVTCAITSEIAVFKGAQQLTQRHVSSLLKDFRVLTANYDDVPREGVAACMARHAQGIEAEVSALRQ